MTQRWEHHTIIGVDENYDGRCWVVNVGTPICGDAIWIPKMLQQKMPDIGDKLSFIVIGSDVLACALGEKLLWDARITLTTPAS